MILCIIGLGIGSTKNYDIVESESQSSNPVLYALLSVLFGIISPVLFAFGGLTVRYFNVNHKMDPFALTLSMYTLDNIILIIAMIFTYKYGSHPFILNEYLEIVASGLLACIGVIFLNKAVTIGLAGPVFALANVQVIIQTILDAIFVGSIPTVLEIVSAVLGIAGKYFLIYYNDLLYFLIFHL